MTTLLLLARGRLHQPAGNLGRRLTFADGTSATVYRETVVDCHPAAEPVVLMVTFRMRLLNGPRGQAYFRWVSLLNTPLFVGFPGFVSKIWLTADEQGRYRGFYEWDGAGRAEDYVRALWWPLALVSRLDSVRYRVLPGRRRDDILAVDAESSESDRAWWRPVAAQRAGNVGKAARRRLIGQVGDVIHDLPAFLTAPLFRRWHRHWGATPAEVAESMPGDEALPRAQFRTTRAVSIDAPAPSVWPWLVQVGAMRAGWYSNDLLDNLARPSADTIIPDFQQLEIGQWVPMAPKGTPSAMTAFRVDSFEVNRWLLWTKADSTWAWRLSPTDDGGTRLVTRVHAVYDWRHPLNAALGVLLMEFGDFAMQRRMLLGIKVRAETHSQEAERATRIELA